MIIIYRNFVVKILYYEKYFDFVLINNYKKIPDNFFLRETVTVAKDLLGKIIIRKLRNTVIAGKIVEVEAYIGAHDPACHAYRKYTERSKVLYEDAGTMYVYFVYGNYYCFNVVTEEKGKGSAVLIRAVEPLEGIDIIKKKRKKINNIYELTNGPGKFCLAFDIDKRFNNKKLSRDLIYIAEPIHRTNFKISISSRIGIKTGTDYLYRFFIKDNPFVSKHKFNKHTD